MAQAGRTFRVFVSSPFPPITSLQSALRAASDLMTERG
jgi:hypothetical protein